jgi:hypothetical protein
MMQGTLQRKPPLVLNREIWLASTLVELADIRMGDSGEAESSDRLVRRLAELLSPGEVGLLLADDNGQLRAVAASSDLSVLAESRGSQHVLNRSLRASQALEAGFERVSAFPLLHGDDLVGVAVVLHHGRIPETLARLAQALTEAAAIALVQRRELRRATTRAEQLQGALDSRVVIEQAKGAIAARLDVTPSAAFELLRGYARRNNLKLAEVCAAAIERKFRPQVLRP